MPKSLFDTSQAVIDYLETKPRATAIVTNPPYKNKLAQRFTEKAINEVDFVAMYLRLTFMESKGRHKLFKNYPPNVLVFSARMNCEEHKFDTFKVIEMIIMLT